MNVSKISLGDSAEWINDHGVITHRSGRFFQIAGLRYRLEDHDITQPIIVQQEIGILGFIIHEYKLLAYAKVEPGNVNAVQLAPTCQATASNLDRVHQGNAPFFGYEFTHNNRNFLHDSMQSEQGTRFFKKQNRNILLASHSLIAHDDLHQWLDVDAVLELMQYDFMINTDARSTLVCSPWDKLVNREPFTRVKHSFSAELRDSLSTITSQNIQNVKNDAKNWRASFSPPSLIPLDELADWNFDNSGVISKSGKHFDVFQIRVDVQGREKPAWDQPIISSHGEGYVELIAGRIDQKLHFLFTLQKEPGLYNAVELGPSLTVAPGSDMQPSPYASSPDAKVILEYKQSDEGGRFFQDVSTYRLIDIGTAFPPPPDGYWLTLAEIRQLLNEGGWFTNEARSVLSLLLVWL